jgi:hypothetical protein
LPWKACRSAADVAAVRALAGEADPVGWAREVTKGRVAAVGFVALARTPAPVNKVNKMAGGDLAADAGEDCSADKAA